MPMQRVRELIKAELADLAEIRHDLHAHPELAYQERRTSGVVVRELQKLGIIHKAGLAALSGGSGTGVIAHLPATRAGSSCGSIALRADIDALPITERTGAAYASKTAGLMHACGHDGHTANLIGVARVLSKIERPSPVTLIFQPAEEGGGGGKRLCDEGALDGEGKGGLGEPVTRIYGLHGWPQLPVGVVASRPGPLLAATDNFTVTIKGTQAHAAYPHLAHDPIVAAAQLVTALQTIASRTVPPLQSVVVTIGIIKGGTARNIIPESASFTGTMRTLSADIRALARTRFFEICEHGARAMGCAATIDWEEGYPVTENEPGATARFFEIARRIVGADRVAEVPEPSMGGEDFSYYGRHPIGGITGAATVPACFFVLGVRPPDRTEYPSLHQPEYDFNDAALATGIEVMCGLALEA
ncbi:MAG: amidohydrolase [Phycisphaerales bacterium]|nr:amidohydrolase [Phycisphaerales bacterium]